MNYKIDNYKVNLGGSITMQVSCDLDNGIKFNTTDTYPTEQQAKDFYWNNLTAVIGQLIEFYFLEKQKIHKSHFKKDYTDFINSYNKVSELHSWFYNGFTPSYQEIIRNIEATNQHFTILTSFVKDEKLVTDQNILQLLTKLKNNLKQHIKWDTLISKKFSIKQEAA
jgi:hypothetical protein